MQIQVFSIPMEGDEDATARLNRSIQGRDVCRLLLGAGG